VERCGGVTERRVQVGSAVVTRGAVVSGHHSDVQQTGVLRTPSSQHKFINCLSVKGEGKTQETSSTIFHGGIREYTVDIKRGDSKISVMRWIASFYCRGNLLICE